ncbi:type II toxin-antitoxin system PrlF family antitoxin [Salinicola sp. JS01]|uniref:type II toxin-antitoxin system PrlF family antitoxin n=1 Tax=Salinicola sp. JS01 TaxID=3050071 RepID=UPI00255C0A2B|nr:type II toxin-antitoxin system PrlF family antitoxin [Salinicola sp. JS01]WIX33027.1 type II toxin-antitoxin system PrlF family antitoxin [Salinicola sp. JS01]
MSIEADSTLTDRFQTTVPASVRQALKLKRRDRIHYSIRGNGEVVLTRAEEPAAADPVITSFLAFLERDMQAHPENLHALTAASVARAQQLTADIDVDLDERLPEDDDDL